MKHIKNSISLKILTVLLLLGFFFGCTSTPTTQEEKTTNASKGPKEKEIYIPKDLEDAHRELEKLFPKVELEKIKASEDESVMNPYHLGFGTWLRNNWGLWNGSRLRDYFNEMGIYHPEDMSGILFDTFWRKLHNQPLQLEEQVQLYKGFWRKRSKPDAKSPKDGAEIIWFTLHTYPNTDREDPLYIFKQGVVLYGVSTSDKSIWRYDHDSGKGIEPATAEDKEIIREQYRDCINCNLEEIGLSPTEGK